jgi:hypothetical protein
MNRNSLLSEVKNEYSRLADTESQQHMSQSTSKISAEKYYEKLLNAVEQEMEQGTFDQFHSGIEIVEAVANAKEKWLPNWE